VVENMRSELLMAMSIDITVFWDVASYNIVDRYNIPPKRLYLYSILKAHPRRP
jgi:hypothetical protein